MFSGLHIDNDGSDEEIVSCTITTRAVLGSDNLTSFWETQMKVSEHFVLSSNLSVTLSSNSTQLHIVGGKKLIIPTLQSLLFYPPLYCFGKISITAEVYSMGLHSRSSHSVWIKPFNHKPFIVSSLQDPIVLTEDSQSAAPFTVFERITSSLHSESVQNPKTVRLPFNVPEEELAIALESLPSINAVSVLPSPISLLYKLQQKYYEPIRMDWKLFDS